jgi:hypothetical protein
MTVTHNITNYTVRYTQKLQALTLMMFRLYAD